MAVHISDKPNARVHFIGIGGSSMSGLAGLLQDEGYRVSGSDRTRSHKTDALAAKGVDIHIGHNAENVRDAEYIVFSAAIPETNPERAEAARLGIPQIERCDLIGQLMENTPFAVGVSGTHGKTTTTSMLAQVFMEAKVDPTIHIGGELDFIGGSTRRGCGHDFIVEACEFHSSFLHFHPTVAVILNIDEDHLDYFRDLDHIEQTFAEYAALLPKDGWCIAWGDDPRARRVCENADCNHATFGLGEDCDVRAIDVEEDEHGFSSYTAVYKGEVLGRFNLNIASRSNMIDSLATVAVAAVRGLDMSAVQRALANFRGAHRRFELTSTTDGVRCYTDYGHNPAEIKTAISIAKKQDHKTLWSVWQPHTYSRTKTLFDAFVETFDEVDHLLITDICAAREVDPGDIKSEMLLEPIRARGITVTHTPTFDDAEAYLRAHWQPGDLMISHGCGDIDLLNEQIMIHGDTKPATEAK
ncbi:MAG: UDP-N-acetylmuramate--L-alanine ligase [Clostridia bacterium]|nr:UDP-N-acetylmuramate--L-alanine ligase [Clostridia bacterium]